MIYSTAIGFTPGGSSTVDDEKRAEHTWQ